MTILECEKLSLGYEGRQVINELSFSLKKGSYLCVVGENGSGKTTLLKGLMGFIKPYSGKIKINDAKIGYLPQQTHDKEDFPVSVREVIMSGCLASHRLLPFYNRKDKERAKQNAMKLDILPIMDKSFNELSGGQRQRVLLARALCAAGNLLILDEPVQGLDPVITKELYSIIHKLNKDDKMSVIMISHDVKEAVKYADHILHIGHDSAFFGTTDEYIREKAAGGETNG